ncbi:MAG: hypothetical protein ACOYOF_12535 [Verrucomicrobiaceae bacterium]
MIFRRPKLKILFLLSLLVLVSATAGFFVGIVLSSVINKKKDDPEFWKQSAMKQLPKLKPTEAQQKIFEARADASVQELIEIRKQGIRDVWDVIERTLADVDKELTPEQRETLIKIRPKKPEEAK